jgi:hypothetical protein
VGEPARYYSWESFKPGNEVAVKSGAWSPRRIAQAAEDRRRTWDARLAECPWVEDVDSAEVDAWHQAEAIVTMLVGELVRRVEDNGGRLADRDRWILERIRGAENAAQACRDRLLLNPLSRHRAGVVASDVGNFDALLAEGRAALERGARTTEAQS